MCWISLPHGQPPPPIHGPIPKDLDGKGQMARKLRKKERKEIYARRKTIVEPVFGQAKEGRGLRRFLLRGLEKVNDEWLLWGTTHNLNKLWRFLKQRKLQAMAILISNKAPQTGAAALAAVCRRCRQ
jgi:hypothetical protein